jgi:hypothetical protein
MEHTAIFEGSLDAFAVVRSCHDFRDILRGRA